MMLLTQVILKHLYCKVNALNFIIKSFVFLKIIWYNEWKTKKAYVTYYQILVYDSSIVGGALDVTHV